MRFLRLLFLSVAFVPALARGANIDRFVTPFIENQFDPYAFTAADGRRILGIQSGGGTNILTTTNTVFLTVDNVADLRNISTVGPSAGVGAVYLAGYAIPGDGGASLMRFYPAPVAVLIDDFIYFLANDGGGVWKREITLPFTGFPVPWAGGMVPGTESDGIVNRAALEKVRDFCASIGGGAVIAPHGSWTITNDVPVTWRDNVVFLGDSGANLVATEPNVNFFRVRTNNNVGFFNLGFSEVSSSYVIQLNDSTNVVISGCTFTDDNIGVLLADSGSGSTNVALLFNTFSNTSTHYDSFPTFNDGNGFVRIDYETVLGGGGDGLWEDTTTPGVVAPVTVTNKVAVGPLPNTINYPRQMFITSTDTNYLAFASGDIMDDDGGPSALSLYGHTTDFTDYPTAYPGQSHVLMVNNSSRAHFNVAAIVTAFANADPQTNVSLVVMTADAVNLATGAAVGAFVGMRNDPTVMPTWQNGVLIADNLDTAKPVFIARTNNTPVFEVDGDGVATFGGAIDLSPISGGLTAINVPNSSVEVILGVNGGNSWLTLGLGANTLVGPGLTNVAKTVGFLGIPTTDGAVTGTPSETSSSWAALNYDLRNKHLNIWNGITASWDVFGVGFSANNANALVGKDSGGNLTYTGISGLVPTFAGLTANGTVSVNTGTLTLDGAAEILSSRWNASGTVFSGVRKIALTDTAHAAGSLLDNVSVDAVTVYGLDANGDERHFKSTTLTESSATIVRNFPLSSGKSLGAYITATVNADDGTDFQSRTTTIYLDAVNKAGTVTVGITATDNSNPLLTSGTLSATYTAVANGNSVDLKCNAVSSLTQTTLKCRVKSAILDAQ